MKLTKEHIELIQIGLNTKLESANLIVDGIWGPNTQSVFERYATKSYVAPSKLNFDISYPVKRHISKAVIHCAATKRGQDDGVDVATIDKWHREKGFNGVGYHFVIKRDGLIQEGRNMNIIGAHVRGYNSKTLGICLVGGYDRKGKTDVPINELYTNEQIESLKFLLGVLKEKFSLIEILGHRDFPNTNKACPSFDVRTWLESWYYK